MNRILILAIITLVFTASPSSLYAQEITSDIIQNRYHVKLPRGDKATVYLYEDHSISFKPNFANQNYVHVGWGRWNFSEKEQVLKIQYVKDCKLLNGNYQVTRNQDNIILREGGKKLVFQSIPTQ